jgi:hypothetical protein
MIIPIGSSPKVIESLESYFKYKREINLFDYTLSNFESVLHFIKHINNPINNNDIYDTGGRNDVSGTRVVNHRHIRMSFTREFPLTQSYESYLPIFLDTLNRRLRKLKNIISENSYIDFIHCLDEDTNYNFNCNNAFRQARIYIPTNQMIHDFGAHLRNINPNLDFVIHLIIPPQYVNDYKDILGTLNSPHIKLHFMTQNSGTNVITGGSLCLHWHWGNVYGNLRNDLAFQIKVPSDFNPTLYKKIYGDLSHMTDEQAAQHYVHHGIKENRIYKIDKEIEFDPVVYKRIYRDLSNLTDDEARLHYLSNGIKEDRKYKYEDIFDPKVYKKIHKDLKNLTDREATLHFYEQGIKEGRNIF